MWHGTGTSPETGCRERGGPPTPRAGLPSEEGASGIPFPAGSPGPPARTPRSRPRAPRPAGLSEVREVGQGGARPPPRAPPPPVLPSHRPPPEPARPSLSSPPSPAASSCRCFGCCVIRPRAAGTQGLGLGTPRPPPARPPTPRRALPARGCSLGLPRPPLPGSRRPQLSLVRRRRESWGWGGGGEPGVGARSAGGRTWPPWRRAGPGRLQPAVDLRSWVVETGTGTRPPPGALREVI